MFFLLLTSLTFNSLCLSVRQLVHNAMGEIRSFRLLHYLWMFSSLIVYVTLVSSLELRRYLQAQPIWSRKADKSGRNTYSCFLALSPFLTVGNVATSVKSIPIYLNFNFKQLCFSVCFVNSYSFWDDREGERTSSLRWILKSPLPPPQHRVKQL